MRRACLLPDRPVRPSAHRLPYQRFYSTAAVQTLLAYLSSALIICLAASLYLTRIDAFVPLIPGPSACVEPFRPHSPRRRSPWQLNASFWVHAAALIAAACLSAFDHSANDRSLIRIPSSADSLGDRTLTRLGGLMPRTMAAIGRIWAALVVVQALDYFSVVRKALLRLVIFPLPIIGELRPRLHSLYRGQPELSVSFAMLETAVILVAWQLVNVLYDVYSSQPVSLSIQSAQPVRALAEGLEVEDPFVKVRLRCRRSLTVSAHGSARTAHARR